MCRNNSSCFSLSLYSRCQILYIVLPSSSSCTFPSAFNTSGETDSLCCVLIPEARQLEEVEVLQNFSAVTRNEVLKIFWVRFCFFWKHGWNVYYVFFSGGSQIALASGFLRSFSAQLYTLLCLRPWRQWRKHGMWIRGIWGSVLWMKPRKRTAGRCRKVVRLWVWACTWHHEEMQWGCQSSLGCSFLSGDLRDG